MPRHRLSQPAYSSVYPLVKPRAKRLRPAGKAPKSHIQELNARAHAVRRQHPSWTWPDCLRAAATQLRAKKQ
jgi:hypothetical protein